MNEGAFSALSEYPPKVRARLSRLSVADQNPIAAWLVQNQVGGNLALALLEKLEDLSRSLGQTPAQLLAELAHQVQDGKQLTGKEIGRRVRKALDKQLHPQSLTHGEIFTTWRNSLALPSAAQLKPPQNFEGIRFTLQIEFESTATLKQSLKDCLDSLDNPAWEKLKDF